MTADYRRLVIPEVAGGGIIQRCLGRTIWCSSTRGRTYGAAATRSSQGCRTPGSTRQQRGFNVFEHVDSRHLETVAHTAGCSRGGNVRRLPDRALDDGSGSEGMLELDGTDLGSQVPRASIAAGSDRKKINDDVISAFVYVDRPKRPAPIEEVAN